MSEIVSRTRCRRPAPWVGGVLLVLAGLFGMHGLDTHEIEAMAASTSAEMTSSMVSPTSAPGHPGLVTAVPAAAVAVVDVAARTVPAGMDMTMGGMCLAVLALALILLVALLRDSPRRAVLWGVPRPGPAREPARLTAPPPDLVALSVRRC